MGYYVAILRSPDIESASENPISREEWLACVRDDPKMRGLADWPDAIARHAEFSRPDRG